MDPFIRFSEALSLLLQAHGYAQELQRSPWDFALELEALREAGLNHNDCRWLVYQNYLLHSVATGLPRETEGTANATAHFVLTSGSCFILTRHGVALARAILADKSLPTLDAPASASESDNPLLVVPRWDKDRRELWLGTALVKQFKVPALNQEIILAAFQEEQWPVCLDDPLPPQPTIDPKKRLHDTVGSLNRNQKRFLIRFFGNGNGQGVRWEPVSANSGDGVTKLAVD